MHFAAHCHRTMAAALAIILLVAFSGLASAQFDPSSIKKKVEKAVRSTTGEETQKTLPGGEAPEEIISRAASAVRPLMNIRSVYQGQFAGKSNAEEFYNTCREVDYATQRQRVEQAVAMKPDAREREQFSYEQVMEQFPSHFANLTKQYLIPEINNAIEIAYAEKAKGASRAGAALEAAESAVLVADGILLVTPGHPEVQTLRADAQAAVASMGAARDAVYAGSFARENAGKVIFSSEPIVPGSENPAAMRTSFTTNDNIYGVYYLKGTFEELTRGSNHGYMKLFVDGNEKAGYDFKMPADGAANAWLIAEVIPDPAVSTTRGAAIFTKAISELSPRKHSVKLQSLDGHLNVLAEGEFQLDCTTGLDRVREVNRQLGDKKLASVGLPNAAMNDPKLENECKAALKDWKEKVLKVIITDREWTIQRHPISGAIVSRTINTTVVVKKPDGGCRMFQVSFEQPYSGKKYGKAQQYGVGDSADIQCEKVK